jgi:hypothetical protein
VLFYPKGLCGIISEGTTYSALLNWLDQILVDKAKVLFLEIIFIPVACAGAYPSGAALQCITKWVKSCLT